MHLELVPWRVKARADVSEIFRHVESIGFILLTRSKLGLGRASDTRWPRQKCRWWCVCQNSSFVDPGWKKNIAIAHPLSMTCDPRQNYCFQFRITFKFRNVSKFVVSPNPGTQYVRVSLVAQLLIYFPLLHNLFILPSQYGGRWIFGKWKQVK